MNGWARDALSAVVDGDARQITALERFNAVDLAEAACGQNLMLKPRAVARVLSDFSAGRIDGQIAQRWASFVRYGMVAGRGAAGVAEVAIDYEPACEDEIVYAVGRLDELGDQVDGVLLPGEVDQLLASLGR